MFVNNMNGILMKVEENPTTRYDYEVWFDYTRLAINTISEGAMLAVPNFAGNETEVHYSIIEVTGVLPMHYALGSDTSGYPGFVTEAASNASKDWITQEKESQEDTTKIRCAAIPTNLEILEAALSLDGDRPIIQEEKNLPMVGYKVHLLDTAMTERIANLSIALEYKDDGEVVKHENAIQIGNLVRDEKVRTFLKVEELIKVHFGIFGFTGAGKSNLLSTLVRKLIVESSEPVKIVIFDLMSEYTGLLLDQLVELDGGKIINIGVQTVPESVLTYYKERIPNNKEENSEKLKKATIDFVNTTVLPKALKRRQEDLHRPAAIFLRDRKMLFWQQKQRSIADVIASAKNDFKGNMGNCETDVYRFIKELSTEFQKSSVDSQTVEVIHRKIDNFINDDKRTNKISSTARKNLDLVVDKLGDEAEKTRVNIPNQVSVSVPTIVNWLNDPNQKNLLIIQAHDPDELREFASMLSGIVYESRRKTGQITPLVSFIFDEADEFIPGRASNESQQKTKAAVMSLARRGRKFGLGIGIATQRIANLDVNTLAQPHTYFVSKLPRQYDRQAIADAFGISEDMFRQTFKFKKGDWLLASYDAAGLDAIPIPIHTENADEQILKFAEEQAKNNEKQKND